MTTHRKIGFIGFVIAISHLAFAGETVVPLPGPTAPGSQAASPAAQTQPAACTYLGTPRTAAWLNAAYRNYGYQVAIAGDRYVNLGREIAEQQMSQGVPATPAKDVTMPRMPAGQVPIGTICESPSGAKILQVIGKSELLVLREGYEAPRSNRRPTDLAGMHNRIAAAAAAPPSTPELLFHVQGIDTKGLIDNAPFHARLLCTGTYNYTSTAGAVTTVLSYTRLLPVTLEQFADALNRGTQLTIYRVVTTGARAPAGNRSKELVPDSSTNGPTKRLVSLPVK